MARIAGVLFVLVFCRFHRISVELYKKYHEKCVDIKKKLQCFDSFKKKKAKVFVKWDEL